jgi:hypothetical protein
MHFAQLLEAALVRLDPSLGGRAEPSTVPGGSASTAS